MAFRDNFPESAVFADKADTDSFQAYIPTARFDETELRAVLADFPLPDVRIDYVREEVEDKNWNEEWEKNYFQPLLIGTPENPRCVVSSTFHTEVPAAPYAIKINPQMSFGTGHHQTTAQMLERLLDDEVRGLEVLDMGCGTGILAILASCAGLNTAWPSILTSGVCVTRATIWRSTPWARSKWCTATPPPSTIARKASIW